MQEEKERCTDEKLENMEVLNEQNDTKNFYKETEWFRKEYKPRLSGCKDKNGSILTEEETCAARWTEHFKELLNKERTAHEEIDLNQMYQSAEPDISKPTLEVVEKVLKKMKNHKAPGEDNITSELLKKAGDIIICKLHEIITKIWDEEEIPEDWKTGLICPIPIYKKGDKLNCTNYRGISLLNIAYKVFSNILLQKLSEYTEEIIGEYQCGFWKNRSITDQIFVMRQIMEKCYEHNINLHLLFIDFQKAFDSVYQEGLYWYMERKGIPKKLIKLTQMTLSSARAKVLVDGRCGDQFELNRGVRQGDTLSATLFNIALHRILEKIATSGTIASKSKQICAYADDVVFIARNERTLKEMYIELQMEGKKMGLEINVDKTKYMQMTTNIARQNRNDLTVENSSFQNVTIFTYLGAEINSENKTGEEIQRRIMAGNKAYSANIKLITSRSLSRATKVKIYKTLIRPVVTYGAETWNITAANATKLRVFERKIIRRIYGGTNDW